MESKKPIIELELYLIRHGESEGNLPRDNEKLSMKDLHDPRLTKKGENQAKAVAEYLKTSDFDAVFSSALRRALSTATEIINRQPRKQPLQILPAVTEAGVSAEYVTDLASIHQINPGASLADGLDVSLPLLCYTDSKDEAGLFERAKKALNYIRSRYSNGEKVAVVCHAAIMTYICFLCMGFEEKVPVFDLNFRNTGVTKVILYKKGTNPYGDTVFDYINSSSHLDNL